MIHLEEKYLRIVKQVLSSHLGKNMDIFVFGSRTNGNHKLYSDLDIAIKGKVDDRTMIKLKNDFQESTLPIKVDVILLDEISDEFLNTIKKDLVKLK